MKHIENILSNVPHGTEKCPLCNSPHIQFKYDAIRDYASTDDPFSILCCNNCSLLYTYPIPENLDRYYDSNNYISHSEDRQGIINKLYYYFRNINLNYKYKLTKKHSTGNNWADYGAGAGSFCAYATKKGIHITAYEPNAYARESSIKKGVETYDSVDFLTTTTSYNCITLWHVLEHIVNPTESLNQFHKRLKQNGVLILALPNHNSFDCQYYNKYWAAWDVPRHLWHFNETALNTLAKNTGFEILTTYPLYFDSFYVSALSEKYKKGFLLIGFIIGFISNVYAFLNRKPYSSMIYILKKHI